MGTPVGVPPGLMGVPDVRYPPVRVPPWPGLMGGTQGGVPHRGTSLNLAGVPPCLDLAGLTPTLTWLGYPHTWTWLNYHPPPPHLDLAWVPPAWTWLRYPPAGPGLGTLLGVDRRTDACQNITFPRTTYAVGKNV